MTEDKPKCKKCGQAIEELDLFGLCKREPNGEYRAVPEETYHIKCWFRVK